MAATSLELWLKRRLLPKVNTEPEGDRTMTEKIANEKRGCANCAHHPDNVQKFGGVECQIRFHPDWWPDESTELFLLHNPGGDDGTCEYWKDVIVVPRPPGSEEAYIYLG